MKDLENSPRVHFDAKNFSIDLKREGLFRCLGRGVIFGASPRYANYSWACKAKPKTGVKAAVEMLWSCIDLDQYPAKDLDALWKKLLINQFHDIIPGSSINLVYQTTHKEYGEIHKACDDLIDQSAKMLFNQNENNFVLMNSLSYQWEGMVTVPESFHGYEILHESGKNIEIQTFEKHTEVFVSLPPLSYSTFKKGEKKNSEVSKYRGLVLENELIRNEFNDKVEMISAFDKEVKREVMDDAGNVLSLYEDRPNNWDAWDIDFFYRDALLERAVVSRNLQAQKALYLNK